MPATLRYFLLPVLAACGPSGSDAAGDAGANVGTITAAVVEPADPTVTTQNGTGPTIDFEVRVTYEDGTSALVEAEAWGFDTVGLGAIGSGNGVFTPSGIAAGTGTVTATIAGQTATTTVTVVVDDVHADADFPADGAGRFSDSPTAGPGSANLLYPLAGAVMPSSVPPPHVQWEEKGAAGDLYRVVATAGQARVTGYRTFAAGFDFAWLVESTSWRTLINSATDGRIDLVVDRYSVADLQTHRSQTVTIEVVGADVAGAIYYWQLSDGKLLRITESGREEFLNPPPKPDNGSRCIACHTVSRDGRYLAAELWGGNEPGAIFDLTADLTTDPSPAVVGPGKYVALFSTFSPDASRLMINQGTSLAVLDALSGNPIQTTGVALPTTGAAHPNWSPDGSMVAFIANHNGSWAVDFTVGDLAVLPVLAQDVFDAPRILRPAEGLANSWPSFSPDSQWIAFGRGTHSRGREGTTNNPGALYLIGRDGGAPIELVNANGGTAPRNTYLPNFSPFDAGGYYWLAYYSTRDYGNAVAGTRGTGRRQIWVSAIAKNASGGQDPSRIGYWLPMQNVASDNMSAYWAPAPPVD